MRQFLFRWAITTIAVMVAASLLRGIRYDSAGSLIGAALLLGILNAFVRPVLFGRISWAARPGRQGPGKSPRQLDGPEPGSGRQLIPADSTTCPGVYFSFVHFAPLCGLIPAANIKAMNPTTVLWTYIVLLVAGGLVGFLKAGSKASLITSVSFAAAYTSAFGPGPALM